MKAAVLVANDDIRYMDVEEPKTEEGQVKVKVAVSGICGSDIPRVHHNAAHFYPVILGHEFSGIITEIGSGVKNIKVGDRVAGVPLIPCMVCDECQKGQYALCRNYSFIGSRQNGSNAEYVVVPERNVVKIDDSVTFEQGALFEPSAVALHGVRQNDYSGGGSVAILGAGTIGIFALQWVKLLGAKTTVVFDISPERLKLAEKFGADAVVDTGETGFIEQAKQLAGGIGFDFVFETAGVTATMKMAFELAANKAQVCFIGTPHSDLSFSPSQWENLNRKEFKLTGSWMNYSAPFPGAEWTMTADYFKSGRLKFDDALVGDVIPMENAKLAFVRFKTVGSIKGKILLTNNI